MRDEFLAGFVMLLSGVVLAPSVADQYGYWMLGIVPGRAVGDLPLGYVLGEGGPLVVLEVVVGYLLFCWWSFEKCLGVLNASWFGNG